jgi:outer membrane protein assembly factor BamD (BamD/ComL family)
MSIHQIDEHKDHKEIQRHVYACMETGNHGLARTVLDEYNETHPAQCEALRLQLSRDYGTGLK